MQSLYIDVQCAVKVSDYLPPLFMVSQGVKQGCKLFPTLFSIYNNEFANDIKEINLGVDNDELHLSILLYADDVALIAPDVDSLQLMLDKLNEWCCKWRLTMNGEKSKEVHFRPASVQLCNNQFSCGNISIQLTDKYKYIGLWSWRIDTTCLERVNLLAPLYVMFFVFLSLSHVVSWVRCDT